MISRAPPLLFAQSFSTQAHKVGSNAVGVKRPFGALEGPWITCFMWSCLSLRVYGVSF